MAPQKRMKTRSDRHDISEADEFAWRTYRKLEAGSEYALAPVIKNRIQPDILTSGDNMSIAKEAARIARELEHFVADDINQDWKEQAYPLKQITINLQGTRHSRLEDIVEQLDHIRDRILNGCTCGTSHDDDFGFAFSINNASDGPSFFDNAGRGHSEPD